MLAPALLAALEEKKEPIKVSSVFWSRSLLPLRHFLLCYLLLPHTNADK